MRITKDTRVFTAHGEAVGDVDRMVLDPRTKQVTHVVVGQGLSDRSGKVVPLALIERGDEKEVYLKSDLKQASDLPNFNEPEYVILDEEELYEQGDNPQYPTGVPAYYYYPIDPALGTRTMGAAPSVSGPTGFASPFSPYPDQPTHVRNEDENIPAGTVAIKEGAKVIAPGGKTVGKLEQIILTGDPPHATHFVIERGLLLKARKLIPVDWVVEVHEDEVYISVGLRTIQRLPDFEE